MRKPERKSKGKKTDTQRSAATPAVKVKAIRARVGTTLALENGQLVLTSTGDDPGLTFDGSDIKAAGPYTLTFRLQSSASGDGEIYWTTDVATSLPKGRHQTFNVTHDDQWRDLTLNLDEPKILYALRLDPCAGKGVVRLDSLQLKVASGRTIKA